MPNDLSVAGAGSANVSYDFGHSSQTVAVATPASPSVAAAPVVQGPGLPNPTLQLDPALNLVVMQLHNSKGEVTSSIPSQRQLEAYRTGLQQVPVSTGAPPVAAPEPAAPSTPAAPAAAAPAATTPGAPATRAAPPVVNAAPAAAPGQTTTQAAAPTPAPQATPAAGAGAGTSAPAPAAAPLPAAPVAQLPAVPAAVAPAAAAPAATA